MRRTARFWTTAIAAAALVTLPMMVSAQTYPPSSGQQTSGQSSESSQYKSGDQNSPQFHLDEAKRVLDSISTADLPSDVASRVSTIKTEFTQLYDSYRNTSGSSSSSATSSSTGASSSSATSGEVGTSGGMNSDWKTQFNKIESDLDRLNIPKSSYAPSRPGMSSGASGTAGTSGSAGSGGAATSGANVNLPSDVRDSLTQFRMHLEQFYSLTAQPQ